MAVSQHWVSQLLVVLAAPTQYIYIPSKRRVAVSVLPTAGTVTISYTSVPADQVATTTLWTTTSISSSAVAALAYIDGPVTAIKAVVSGTGASTTVSVVG